MKIKKILNLVLVFLFVCCIFACGKEEYQLTIDISSNEIYVGEVINYNLIVDNKVIDKYTYECSDNDILKVEIDKLTGLSEGSCEVTFNYTYKKQDLEKVITITVVEEEIINPHTLTIETEDSVRVDEWIELKVKIDGNETTAYNVFSSNQSFLTFNDYKLFGLSEGEVVITVVAVYNGFTMSVEKTITVTEKAPAPTLTIETENSVYVNESIPLTVKVNGNVINDFEVSISDPSILGYQSNQLKGLKQGEVVLTIKTVYNGYLVSVSKNINVSTKEDYNITTTIPDVIYLYSFIDLKVYLDGVEINDFEFKSSNTRFLEYNNKTKILEIYDKGKATITITFVIEGKTYTYNKDIDASESLSFRFNYTDFITVNAETPLEVYVMPMDIKIEEFNSSITDSTIISITDGIIKGLKAGKTTVNINAKYESTTVYGSFVINVNKYIEPKLTLNLNSYIFLNQEENVKVFYSITDDFVDAIITIDDLSIISLSNNKIKALKEGKTKIKAKYLDLECEIEVNVYSLTGIDLVIKNDPYVNEVVFYEVKAKPSNITINEFNISSSDTEIMLANNSGCFTKKEGQCQIIATYQYLDKSFTDQETIDIKVFELEVKRIALTGSTGIIENGTTNLNVFFYPSSAAVKGSFTFGSEDSTIATLTDPGLLTGIKNGQTKVYVSYTYNGVEIKTYLIINVFSRKDMTEFALGKYLESDITSYHELINGVTHTTYTGFSSTQTPGIDADGFGGITETNDPNKLYQQQVNVLSVPSSNNLKIIPWANLTNHKWSLTTVKALIDNYEKTNPGKKVVAAINGDFFDINGNYNLPYQTVGENISDGEFYKTNNGFGSGGGMVGFMNDGSTNSLVSTTNPTRTQHMILAVYDDDHNIIKEFNVDSLNSIPANGKSSVYFGVYNAEHTYLPKKLDGSNNFTVTNATLALPNSETDFYGKGVISEIKDNTFELGIGQFAINTTDPELLNYLKIGVTIRVQFEYANELSEVKSATGFNGVILEDDWETATYTDGNLLSRAPRTVVGMKADGTIVMMVIDGRQGASNMFGADGYELASIMKSLGCVRAYNLDGGGSSTMVIRTESGLNVVNSPSDGRERTDANCILIVADDPTNQVEVKDITSTSAKINITNPENNELYALIDGVYHTFVNNTIQLTNLVSNNIYKYTIYIKKNNEFIKTLIVGQFTTLKDDFIFLGITFRETETQYIFNSYAIDYDLASNVDELTIIINDKTIYLSNNTLTINKSTFGEIESLSFKYFYNYGNKTETIEVKDYFIY